MSIQSPGAYLHVLEKRAERELFDLLAPLSESEGVDEMTYRARVTALVDQRLAAGEPVNCQSWELPQGLHAPFHRWPVAGRTFVVTADDRITLRRREPQ
ncbi:hypothetical protein [Mycobacterium colombiense]|nr:hypothetical protein [Mycobacterium colombiense]